jgi:spore germination cell wall hydrolase CwlJ-like protein
MKKKIAASLLSLVVTIPCFAGGTEAPEVESTEEATSEDTEIENKEESAEASLLSIEEIVETEVPETIENPEALENIEEVYIPPFEERYVYAENYTDEELIAMCVEAEAGNQSILGKRLVADTIYNRTEMENFPATVKEVILQEYAYQVVTKGRLWEMHPSASTYAAVQMEADPEMRVERDVVYFQTESYPDYGYPYEHVGDHYFATQHKHEYTKNDAGKFEDKSIAESTKAEE